MPRYPALPYSWEESDLDGPFLDLSGCYAEFVESVFGGDFGAASWGEALGWVAAELGRYLEVEASTEPVEAF